MRWIAKSNALETTLTLLEVLIYLQLPSSRVCNVLMTTDCIILVQYLSSLYWVVLIILRIYLLDFCATDGAALWITRIAPECSSLKWIGPLRRDKWATIKYVSESTSRLRCGCAKFKIEDISCTYAPSETTLNSELEVEAPWTVLESTCG